MSESNRTGFFRKTISLLTVGYNKGIILSRVTQNAMNIITRKIAGIRDALGTVVTSFEEIRATSESTSANTANIYSSMKEIIESSTAINTSIQKNVDEITHTTEESQTIQALFNSLEAKSNQVKEMTREIDDVAQQTNILAINASIEAARAGTAGKGFHIIAKEVRSLSVQTQEFANSITGTINEFNSGLKQVKGSFDGLIVLLDNFKDDLSATGRTFDQNKENLENSGYLLSEIKAGIAEQTEAMTDGLKSLEAVFSLLKDTDSISYSLGKAHGALDKLLDKKS